MGVAWLPPTRLGGGGGGQLMHCCRQNSCASPPWLHCIAHHTPKSTIPLLTSICEPLEQKNGCFARKEWHGGVKSVSTGGEISACDVKT